MRKRVRNDKDLVIGLCSCIEEGSGKSTLAIVLGLACDPNFSLRNNELYSPTEKEAKDKILNLPKYSVIVADEAIKILYKLRWATTLQIFLNTLYALARKENKITILCMPRFRDFNEFFRNHKIRIWIEILERGTAVVFAKDWSPFAKDPWWIDDNQKFIDRARKHRKYIEYSVAEKIEILSKSKNFVGILKWDKLPNSIWNEYEKLRDKVKYKGLDSMAERESERVTRYSIAFTIVSWFLKKLGFSEGKIARMTGFSQPQISYLFKKYKTDIEEAESKEAIKH